VPVPADTAPTNEESLVALQTTPRQRYVVLVLCLLLAILSLLILPFAQNQLGQVNPFIPIFITAVLIGDLITTYLVWSQFLVDRRPAVAILAATYLFSGLITIPYIAAFPGVFMDNSQSEQSSLITNWNWIFWHVGFPLGILSYLLVDWRWNKPFPDARAALKFSLLLLAGVIGLLVVLSLISYQFNQYLPVLIRQNDFSPLLSSGVGEVIWLLNLLAFGAMVWRTRGRTVVQLWMILGLLAWLLDVTLNLWGGSRFSVGWYSARVNTMLTTAVVLGALFYEVNQLYRKTQQTLIAYRELDLLKNQFMSIASHELRTPLTSIKGYSQMLERSLQKQLHNAFAGAPVESSALERNLSSSRNILHQSNRMQELINRLFDFSRIQNGQLELNLTHNVDLGQMLEHIVEQHQSSSTDHRLIITGPAHPLFISCDVARLEQVFENLISNAFKYSPPGTTVEVSLKPDEAAHQAIISVRDEGQGISPEHQNHIFEQFFRARTDHNRGIDGLGLGLFISYSIVEQHGGRMWVESALGQGSTFYLALPLQPASTSLEPASDLQTQPASS
jgi:signal transduction histidine kinase